MDHNDSRNLFGTLPDGQRVEQFRLVNKHGTELKVLTYGCTIRSLKIPARNGNLVDIVLGFDSLAEYLNSGHYIGAIIGRYANRIAHGLFPLDGHNYKLAINQSPHHLHGGTQGYDKVIWKPSPLADEESAGIQFHYMSPHSEEGYPGNLKLSVSYILSDENTLTIHYHAESDKNTIINLTQHSYYNLIGQGDIRNHRLEVNANFFLPVDPALIPTGVIQHVEGTPFDLRVSTLIKDALAKKDDQLVITKGFDHNWVLSKTGEELSYAATLYSPESGCKMQVYTTEPGLQVYTANALKGIGKNGTQYASQSGICLETQHFPDSPNRKNFPSVILNSGSSFESTTVLKFSVA